MQEIKRLVVTSWIRFSWSTGAPYVDIVPYGANGPVSGNDLGPEFCGIPGLVNPTDYRSDWYGWGLSPHQALPPTLGQCKLNARGDVRAAYKRRVKRYLRNLAREAGLPITFDYL